MNRLIILFVLVFTTAAPHASVIELIASLDRNPINADESVTLIVTATGDIGNDQPDFSALNNDFRFNTPSVSRSTQIVNGLRSSSVTWRINLIPKRAGTFIIPKFTLAGIESNSIGLRVMPAGTASSEPREFYLSTELNNDEIYLQQQLVYTVKIYVAGDIQSGSLSEPVLSGAIIEKLGDDNEYEELIDGVRYRIIERNFAVIPQSSGSFVIDSPVFEARVISRLGQNFAYFNRTKTITRVGSEQAITVKPIPDNYQFTWLPSEQVVLEEDWQGGLQGLTVGEPATRTITLTALGLTEEQLPTIEAKYHPSFKTYPEQPQRATVQRDNKLISQSVVNTAIIAEQSGQYVLPEITVPWFNVITGQTEFATIPARSISVVPSSTAVLPNAPPAVDEKEEQKSAEANSDNTPIVRESKTAVLFDWLHLVLLALVFVLSGALIAVTKNKNKTVNKPIQKVENNEEEMAWTELIHAIDNEQVNNVPDLLASWISIVLGKPRLTAQQGLMLVGNAEITDTYNELMSTRYSLNGVNTDKSQFIEKLKLQRESLKSTNNPSALTFYPTAIS
ncbi:MAG: BatD family protein [Pseudomonadota bacterium]